ncbi:MAG: hypothetical protein ABUK01_09835 [Leptospirales bacterium]
MVEEITKTAEKALGIVQNIKDEKQKIVLVRNLILHEAKYNQDILRILQLKSMSGAEKDEHRDALIRKMDTSSLDVIKLTNVLYDNFFKSQTLEKILNTVKGIINFDDNEDDEPVVAKEPQKIILPELKESINNSKLGQIYEFYIRKVKVLQLITGEKVYIGTKINIKTRLKNVNQALDILIPAMEKLNSKK